MTSQPPEQPTPARLDGQVRAGKGKFAGTMNAAERARAACELRAQGLEFEEIAEELGYADKSGAWRAVRSALAKIPAPAAKELRRMQVGDLLEIQRAHFPYAVGMRDGSPILDPELGVPMPPSKDAAEVWIKYSARIAAMYGLDQPKSLRVEMDRQMSQLLDRLQKELPPDVYEQVLAIAAASDGEGEAPEGSGGEAESSPRDEAEGA